VRKRIWPVLIVIFTVIWSLSITTMVLAEGIKVLDPKYKLVRLVKDSPLPGCNGAQIGPDGALYVVHTGNGTISRIDLQAMKAKTFVPPYAGVYIPDDITADDKGNLFVTGMTPLVGEVYRIDKNRMKKVIGSGFKAPNGIQYNFRTGRLFMTECFMGNRVFELDPMGVKEPRLLVPENTIQIPEGFGFDPDTNDLIIPDMGTGKILRVHPDSGAITTITEKFITPVALKVGPDKMAYLVELATGGVYRLSLDGQKREKLAQIVPGLDNLAITADNRLFVTSYWDATVFKVATDGSGKYQTLFPMGPNQATGIMLKGGKVLISDAIMMRFVENGKYVKTKLNAWATQHMPMPLGVADASGDQIFWTSFREVAIGNPKTGEFKPVAGELNLPLAVLTNKSGPDLFVAEYGAGQINKVSLLDGAKKALTAGLEGPIAMAFIEDMLYVAEAKAGRISKVDPATGKKEVFLSGVVAKPGALADDGAGNLLILDGATQSLFRVSTKNLAISVVARNLPVGYALVGSYPPVQFPLPMVVGEKGDIYMATMDRGVIVLKKTK